MNDKEEPSDPTPSGEPMPAAWALPLLCEPRAMPQTPTQLYLTLLKEHTGLVSDAEIASFLMTHRMTVRRWRLGESSLNEAWGRRFAAILGVSAAQLLDELGLGQGKRQL